ncbi:hypothetical protein B0H17DRAFT_1180360 [Mycena rosella]|uniref:Uncharacterized protein n=1 Tax=Mycena rosella TaxID=1033263 RepID=A0AAD7DEE0_MYCRO|nr:hypothetical protein B0H17DRAFT_1180360 [Mycena rosella]
MFVPTATRPSPRAVIWAATLVFTPEKKIINAPLKVAKRDALDRITSRHTPFEGNQKIRKWQGPPLPLYDDRFNTFTAVQHSPVALYQPYPGSMPPYDGREGFPSSSMLLQNAAPLQRRGNMYPLHPSVPPRGPAPYPHSPYQQPSMYQYPTNARPPRATPSPGPSDFARFNQPPRY